MDQHKPGQGQPAEKQGQQRPQDRPQHDRPRGNEPQQAGIGTERNKEEVGRPVELDEKQGDMKQKQGGESPAQPGADREGRQGGGQQGGTVPAK